MSFILKFYPIKLKVYSVVVFLFIVKICCSQSSNFTFEIIKHLNKENAISTNTIYQIDFDTDGRCYFACDKGIGIYDGRTSQIISKQNGLPDKEIFNIKIKDSILYFLPLKGGLYGFNYLKLKLEFFVKGKSTNVFKDIAFSNEKIFLSTYRNICLVNDNNSLTNKYSYKWDGKLDLLGNNFYVKSENNYIKFDLQKLHADTVIKNKNQIDALSVYGNNIFYCSKNIFYRKNLNTLKIDSVLINSFHYKISSIFPISDTLFLVCSESSLFLFNYSTAAFTELLSGVQVNSIKYNQMAGLYFVATNNKGLYILKKQIAPVKTCFHSNVSYYKKNGNSFQIGFENGSASINKFSIKQNNFKVNCVEQFGDLIFLGFDKGGQVINIKNRKEAILSSISTVKQSVIIDSNVYVITSKALLAVNLNTSKVSTIIPNNHRSYYLQRHGNLLFSQSYNTDSLLAYDYNKKEIRKIDKFIGQVVKSIQINEAIYFVTDLGMLYKYSNKHLSMFNLSEYMNYNLKDISVFEFVKGECIIIGNPQACISIKTEDLYAGRIVLKKMDLHTPSNAKFIQIHDSILSYVIDSCLFESSYLPRLIYKDFFKISIQRKTVNAYKTDLFSYPKANLNLNFGVINYVGSNENINCCLICSDGQILTKTSGNQFTFDSIPVGTNYIVAYGIDNRLNKSNIVKFPLVIVDSFTNKTLFLMLFYSILVSLVSYGIYRYRLSKIKAQHKLKLEYVLIEQKASALLMNPHFIFNALGNIQGFIGTNQMDKANDYLLRFSIIIRSYLNFMHLGIVTLDKELKSVEDYIDFQKIKYTNINYTLEIKSNRLPTSITIPAFVIQPFLENSIKYFKGNNPILNINLEVSINDDFSYSIKISDNGPGFPQAIINKSFYNKNNNDFKSLEFTINRLSKIHLDYKKEFNIDLQNIFDANKNIIGACVILNMNSLK